MAAILVNRLENYEIVSSKGLFICLITSLKYKKVTINFQIFRPEGYSDFSQLGHTPLLVPFWPISGNALKKQIPAVAMFQLGAFRLASSCGTNFATRIDNIRSILSYLRSL
ncbi:hypothetical protein, partial [Loigolactobacillus backii]|uniref:hypothetical protein n=2 Tax=Lactobacillaceae TaxID=33958 RepID=UPI0022FD85E7